MRATKTIMLVEDDQVDAMTVKRAFRDINKNIPVHHIENGEQAIEYLKNSSNPTPDIILLDLNMPRMNGLEFLEIVKNDDDLRSIPIIVLTTSAEEYDRQISFRNSVAGYMVKPVDYQQFVSMMKTISDYWSTSELP